MGLWMAAIGVWLGGTGSMTAQEEKTTPIERLIRAADVGDDKKFQELLSAEKQADHHTAPARLRELLASFRVLRMDMGQAYAHEEGKAALVWWFGEIGIAGDVDNVGAQIADAMKSAGFTAAEGEKGRKKFTLSKDGVTQEIGIEGPHRWVGGKETACGIRMMWKVADEKESPAQTLEKLLGQLPVLKDDRLEDSVYIDLASLPVARLAFGGTWTRYYDWDATFAADSPEAAAKLHERLRKLVSDLGYEEMKSKEDPQSFERKKTGSFGWLHAPDAKHRVRLRFQPES